MVIDVIRSIAFRQSDVRHRVNVCGDGTRHRIDNDDTLRAWVLDLARQIRAARAAVTVPIPVNPVPGQCRPCGMRGHCGQVRV